jgi:hypothetical protein
MTEKNYDSTIMRIAGNLGGGRWSARDLAEKSGADVALIAREYVRLARAIVAEVQRPAKEEPVS